MYKKPKNAANTQGRVRLLQVVAGKWPAGGCRARLRAAADALVSRSKPTGLPSSSINPLMADRSWPSGRRRATRRRPIGGESVPQTFASPTVIQSQPYAGRHRHVSPTRHHRRRAMHEQRSRRDARHERLFRWLLKGCALLVLASLLGAAGATLWGGREAFATFGWHFLISSDMGPGQRRLRRARAGLRHHRHLADRPRDRRAGQLRHRPLSLRSRACLAAHAGGLGDRTARGHPVDHLRHVGPVHLRAVLRRAHQAVADQQPRQPADDGKVSWVAQHVPFDRQVVRQRATRSVPAS